MADDTFVVGAPLPRIRAVSAHEGLRVTLTWESAGPGARIQTIDLAPAVFRYKLYAPLRDDPALFRSVRVIDDGFAIGWDGEDLDMASTTIAELAEQVMTPADFADFVKRNGYTLDSIAAELGISRRLAAYYAKEREIPRYISLACRFLDRPKENAEVSASHYLTDELAEHVDATLRAQTGLFYIGINSEPLLLSTAMSNLLSVRYSSADRSIGHWLARVENARGDISSLKGGVAKRPVMADPERTKR